MEPATVAILVTAFGIVTPVLQMIRSIYRTIKKEKNEDKFKEHLAKLIEANENYSRLAADPSVLHNNPAKLEEAKRVLQELLQRVDKQVRQSVEEGLLQPSERGRKNYTIKILQESNAKALQEISSKTQSPSALATSS